MRIIACLEPGPKRFGEIERDLPGISPNILTTRLRSLNREGLIIAVPYSRRPLRMSYVLSESGLALGGAIALLAAWGARRGGQPERARHRSCGTTLEATLFCPTCERSVESLSEDNLRWL